MLIARDASSLVAIGRTREKTKPGSLDPARSQMIWSDLRQIFRHAEYALTLSGHSNGTSHQKIIFTSQLASTAAATTHRARLARWRAACRAPPGVHRSRQSQRRPSAAAIRAAVVAPINSHLSSASWTAAIRISLLCFNERAASFRGYLAMALERIVAAALKRRRAWIAVIAAARCSRSHLCGNAIF